MDLATVTPSLVILGAPYGWAMIALRPLGPSVTYYAVVCMQLCGWMDDGYPG